VRAADGELRRVENVIARIRGTGGAARGAVLVSAHYDSVAAGPGAGDGAGVATLLELARIFAEAPPVGRDLILLWVDGEEDGLLGAEAFVAAPSVAPEVAVALNIDAGGNYGVATFTRASLGNARAIAAIAAAGAPAARGLVDDGGVSFDPIRHGLQRV
jgi:Zn-dependent M28 family amino/carboxypeptidase